MIDITGEVAQIVAAIFTAVGVVVVAVITTRTRRDVEAVKHEVKNDHAINFRVEQDTRHDENSTKLDYLVRSQQWLVHMALNNRTDISHLQEHTGQGRTRRARRLAGERPPISQEEIPKGPTP